MTIRPFPILFNNWRREEAYNGPRVVPWWLIEPHAAQAIKNHGQTLQRLAERGGLAPAEMVAVLEDRDWTSMTDEAAGIRIRAILMRAVEQGVTDDGEEPGGHGK